MLPWSVIPIAGCPSATALATISSRRAAPSSIENSVWTWRWVNESDMAGGTTLPHDPGESQWCGLRTYPAREKRVQILGPTPDVSEAPGVSEIRAGTIRLGRNLAAWTHLRRHRPRRQLPQLLELL